MAVIPEFVVTIPVKPYVKRFIEVSYGLPADFSKYPKIQEMVHRCLKKPCTRYDRKYKTFQLSTYSENLEIVISKHYFNRYGCVFSITDTISFGHYFEYKIKDVIRELIGVELLLGKPLKSSIIEIREFLGFDETQWKYESILKYFHRYIKKHEKSEFSHNLKIHNKTLTKRISEYTLRNSVKISNDSHLITDVYFENIMGQSVGNNGRLPPKTTTENN